jgi:hypothetical protein
VQIEQKQAGDGPRVARESKNLHACLVVPNHDRAIVRSRRDSVHSVEEEVSTQHKKKEKAMGRAGGAPGLVEHNEQPHDVLVPLQNLKFIQRVGEKFAG